MEVDCCGQPLFFCEKRVNKGKKEGKLYLSGMKEDLLLKMEEFEYDLPDHCIAYTPCENRSDSKLLVWDKEIVASSYYKNLDEFIPIPSTLVFNDSKVIAARIFFEKSPASLVSTSNPLIEIFCLEPTIEFSPMSLAMQANKKVQWVCLVGGAKKWKQPLLKKIIEINNITVEFIAKKIKQEDGQFIIEFSWDNENIIFSEILSLIGNIPLPPYIQREANEQDKQRYQTTYAKEEGSVAAPTAGLHFSKSLLDKLSDSNINQQFITLHVGAGTFLPVKASLVADHQMHAEFIEVQKKTIQYFLDTTDPIICVGTTSLRTIESLYWLGVKIAQNPFILPGNLCLLQWDAYELKEPFFDKRIALQCLIDWMDQHHLNKLITSTQLIILPGYTFKICNGLITNFHQPKSTLLLIIAAIVGEDWKKIYQYAMDHEFRFLSYGDGCFFKF